MRLLLVGNYGTGNLGDEMLREYFLRTFSGVEWIVVSATPQRGTGEVPRLPGGLRSLLSFSWTRTLRALWKADGVVLGGGSLFTDSESVYACMLWWLHVNVAYLFFKPVFFAFQGLGPFRTKAGEWFTRSALRMAAFISVRDTLSLERGESFNLNKKIVQSFDPIFSFLKGKKNHDRSKNVFIIIPRGDVQDSFTEAVFQLAHARECDAVNILLLQPGSALERHLAQRLAERIPGAILVPVQTSSALAEQVNSASFVCSARYHGALAALALGIPFSVYPQAPGDKLSGLPDLVGREQELADLVRRGEDALRDALDRARKTREAQKTKKTTKSTKIP